MAVDPNNMFSSIPEVPDTDTGENVNMMVDHNILPEDDDQSEQPDGNAPQIQIKKQNQSKAINQSDDKSEKKDKTPWKDRYTNLQSYTDKKLREMQDSIRSREDQFNSLMALEQHIKSNPDLLNVVEASLTGKPIPKVGAVQNQVIPQYEVPPKPAEFDPAEMYDPNTPSGKWAIQAEKARQQALTDSIITNVVGVVDQRLGRMEANELARRQQQEKAMAAEKAKSEINRYFESHPEMEDEEKNDLLQFIASGPGRPLTLDELNILRKATNGRHSSIDAGEIEQRVKTAKTSAPAFSRTASHIDKEPDEAQAFSMSLLDGSKKKWKIL